MVATICPAYMTQRRRAILVPTAVQFMNSDPSLLQHLTPLHDTIERLPKRAPFSP